MLFNMSIEEKERKILETMLAIANGARVVVYGYRTALVGDPVFEIDREDDLVQCLEFMLASRASVTVDNHTTYELTLPGEGTLFIFCSDGLVRFGRELIKKDW